VIPYIIIAIAILFSAFFSSAEIAYSSLNQMRLDAWAEKGRRTAKVAKKIVSEYDRTLSSILIGNNLVNNMASSVATTIALSLAAAISFLTESVASTIANLIITVLILIFGEIVPKILAKKYPLGYACAIAYPLFIITRIFYPISFVVAWIINKVTARLHKDEDKMVTEEELSAMFETAEEEGVVDEDPGELLQSALDYQETTVEDILVPRINLQGIDILEDSADKIREICLSTPYSRLPIYEDSLDHIVGILSVYHYLLEATNEPDEDPDIRALMHEPIFVHKTTKLPDALADMKESQSHMVVVMDEYGGTMGIVTMEDILEEIVGEIWDEYDAILPDDVVTVGEDEWHVDGMTPINEFFEDIDFEDRAFESEYTTMGGWAVEMLEEDPHEGDTYTYGPLTVTVTEMRDNLVGQLHIVRKENEEEEE
jgi:CBS domain containing-hemolysin-like protein